MTAPSSKLGNWAPSWQTLAILGKSPLFAVSAGVLVGVPLIARIAATWQASEWPVAFLQALEATAVEIPINWLRLFWASFLFAVAQIIYSIAAPHLIRAFRSFKEWSEGSERANELRNELRRQKGAKAEEDCQAALRAEYLKLFQSAAPSRPGIRIALTLIYAAGAVLVLRVISDQAILVWQITPLAKLL